MKVLLVSHRERERKTEILPIRLRDDRRQKVPIRETITTQLTIVGAGVKTLPCGVKTH
jgi:hypothetical protein